MELELYLSVLRRWWWLMALCVIVAAGFSYYGTTQMPREYQATTAVAVGQTLQQVDPGRQDLAFGQELAQTYALLVGRRPILEKAAEALGLTYVPSAANVSARQLAGSHLLEISVRDTDPERARALADEIANQLVLQSPLADMDADRRAFVDQQLNDLENLIDNFAAELEEERAKLEAANSAREIQQLLGNVQAMEQRLGTYQHTYLSMLTNIRGGTNYVSIVEPATTPTRPVSPNVPQTVGLAAAIGLMLAVAGASLIEYLDDTVNTPDDVDRTVGLPTLGSIARIAGRDYPQKLITAREPRSPIAEAYRVLRTNIRFSSLDQPARSVLITSPSPTEGKSLTLANLGVVMAQSGLSVIVVDTDLRRPVLHNIFGLPNSRGLTDAVLSSKVGRAHAGQEPGLSVKDAAESLGSPGPPLHATASSNSGVNAYARQTDVDNLWLLPSGPLPPNPAEMLGSERMRHLLHELTSQADVVLLDSPPVLTVTDAAVLSTQVDATLLVLAAGETRRQSATKSAGELRRVGAEVLGVVLNGVSERSGYYGNYYYRSENGGDGKGQLSDQLSALGRLLSFGGKSSDGAGRHSASPGDPRQRKGEIDRGDGGSS